MENQRRTLEEIFRNGESGQEKTNSLLSVVKEILKKAFQKVLENTEHCSLLGGTVQNSLEGEGPWENGKGPEAPRHYVLIAEKHFLPLAMLGTKI